MTLPSTGGGKHKNKLKTPSKSPFRGGDNQSEGRDMSLGLDEAEDVRTELKRQPS